MSSVRDEALRLLAAGLSVVPIRADGSKAPDIGSLVPYFDAPMPAETAHRVFAGNVGIAVIGGAVSGNAECIDFDDLNTYVQWLAGMRADQPLLLDRLVIVETPDGGHHLWYRCDEPVPGAQKLAREVRPDPKTGELKPYTLIETRGEGSYAVVPPSAGSVHETGRPYLLIQGDLARLPVLAPEDRLTLLDRARGFNAYTEPERRSTGTVARSAGNEEERPGDDYNRRGSWDELLTRNGWALERERGGVQYWRRPGKDEGISASLHAVHEGIFFVFSSNADPLREGKPGYDLFGARTFLEFEGDFSACGRALRAEGFGSVQETVTLKRPKGNGSPSAHGETQTDHEEKDEEDDEERQGAGEDALATEWANLARGRYLFAEGDEWWEYDGRSWGVVNESVIEASVHDWLQNRKGKKVAVRQKRIRELRSLAAHKLGRGGRPVPRSHFNANRGLLPLSNGMLNVETRKLEAHSHEHLNTYCLPYGYDDKATCPRFDRFLQEVMLREDGGVCEEWIDTIQQFMGYCLIPDCRAETTLVNVGEGGNGKSLWGKVLEGLVGDVNCVSIEPRQLEQAPAIALAALYGKLVGFLNEPTRAQLKGCHGSIKALVSGDKVNACAKYKQPFDYRPHVRIVVSCNDMPASGDLSQGFDRRLLMIEWRFRPVVPDRSLDRTLLAELPGILNVALGGLDRLRALDYDFIEPEESKALKKEYRHGQDSAAQFLEECCTTDKRSEELWCVAPTLYRRYAAWCKDSGYAPMNSDVFGKHLTRRLGFPMSRTRKMNGRVFKARYGIFLNDPTQVGADEEIGTVLVQ